VGESSFWYRPTRVVPDQRPLNGRRCRAATTSGIHSETDVVAAEKLISAVYLLSTVKTFSQLNTLCTFLDLPAAASHSKMTVTGIATYKPWLICKSHLRLA